VRKQRVFVLVMLLVVFGLYLSESQATMDFTSDGVIQEGDVYDNVAIWNDATVDMFGGIVSNDLGVNDQSTFNLWDGSVGGIGALDSSTVNLFGGLASFLSTRYDSTANIYGGDLGMLASIGNSLVYLYAYDVVITNTGEVLGTAR